MKPVIATDRCLKSNLKENFMETKLKANDIECDGCANAIKSALGRLDGIESVQVDVAGKEVCVTHSAQTSRTDIEAAMDRAGFPVSD